MVGHPIENSTSSDQGNRDFLNERLGTFNLGASTDEPFGREKPQFMMIWESIYLVEDKAPDRNRHRPRSHT